MRDPPIQDLTTLVLASLLPIAILVKRDLEIMIPAALKAGIPVLIGTGGGCGARPHVAIVREIIEEIAVANTPASSMLKLLLSLTRI